MAGYITISRCIINHWVYADAEYFKLWFEMIARARYKADEETKLIEGQLITLKRGQFVFGRKSWAERLNISEKRIRTFLTKAAKDNMIELISKHSKFTIYEVSNFDKYNYNTEVETDFTQKNQKDEKIGHQKGHHEIESYQSIEETEGQHKGQQGASRGPAEGHKRIKNNNDNNDVINNTLLEIENFRLRYSEEQLKIIDNFLEILKHTRKSCKLAPSVITGIYKDFEKYQSEKVIHGLNEYINKPHLHDKKENYVLGIIRNTDMSQIKPKQENKPITPKVNTKFHNFEQRTNKYDNKALEAMLLGKKG